MKPTEPDEPAGSHCKSCGATLDPMVLGGGCPACVWESLIGEEVEEQKGLADAPVIEGYEVLEKIGQGGMGVVYRATQDSPAREVALKMVAPYSLRAVQARERFLLEVEAMAAVEHPALLPLYDTGEDKHGRPWLTMQLAAGGSLAERIPDYQSDWKKSAELLRHLCTAVQFAHERGILHRDLKPANILFDQEDNAYVADFGLAKWAEGDSGITVESSMLGSPAYLAPEAARGGSKMTTTVSDVYGLGAIFYELLVGDKPYDGEEPATVLTKILDGAPPSPRQRLSEIPRDLEVIILKAMDREPSRRYSSAAAFADDLTRWMEGRPILARPVGRLERCLIWARRNPAITALASLLAISLLVGGILLWKKNRELNASLNDVESLLDHTTVELPLKLAPLGRLDILDPIFAENAHYYEESGRSDSRSLARYANFLRGWAELFQAKGQTTEMLEKLEQAMEKAELAVKKSSDFSGQPGIEEARARISAGIELGLGYHLIIGESNDGSLPEISKAREVLTSTSELTEKWEFDDLEYRVLVARIHAELLKLEATVGNGEVAVAHGKTALEKWSALKPEVSKNLESDKAKAWMISAARVHHDLGDAYYATGNEEDVQKAEDSFSDWLAEVKDLYNRLPKSQIVRHYLAVAKRIEVIRRGSDLEFEEKLRKFIEVDDDFRFLMDRDSSNVRWHTEAARSAGEISRYAKGEDNPELSAKWLEILIERVKPLYKHRATSDLRLLVMRREEAAYCADEMINDRSVDALFHFTVCVETQVKIARLAGKSEEERLQRMVTNIGKFIAEQVGPEDSQRWKVGLKLEEYAKFAD